MRLSSKRRKVPSIKNGAFHRTTGDPDTTSSQILADTKIPRWRYYCPLGIQNCIKIYDSAIGHPHLVTIPQWYQW